MKKIALSFIVFALCSTAFGGDKNDSHKQHNTIYTKKIKRIVNAVNVGDFSKESEYMEMLQTACQRNRCNNIETQTIRSVGHQIVHCKITHLEAHGIKNPDAISICNSKNAMIGCDTLATPLLRKMCYTGNSYSLRVLRQKEAQMKSRMPASE
jgi:hypothetical protein